MQRCCLKTSREQERVSAWSRFQLLFRTLSACPSHAPSQLDAKQVEMGKEERREMHTCIFSPDLGIPVFQMPQIF